MKSLHLQGSVLLFMFFLTSGFIPTQLNSIHKVPIGFATDDLITGFTSPTSLSFGPDGRLYVAQQDGTISIFSVSRLGIGDYQIDSTEVINSIKTEIPNHNDDGIYNPTQKRQATGILLAGTASNPILYVSSSDWRIKVGQDSNLDTNSSTISRFTWIGTDISDPAGYWDKVDIVRGLVRSEENHSINGMSLDKNNNILYIMAGGNTNKGAPSNNFGATPEYALSAALLSIDLDSLENMPVFIDSRTNTAFIYDIPTLDDPSRINIDNTHPDFPYPSNHPSYNSSIDIGDPFGGNNGLNQGRIVPNGPVQVYAPGFRNSYDVVFTSQNKLYAFDNGPNGGWGGPPLLYDAGGNLIGYNSTQTAVGDYSSNEIQEAASTGHGDALYYISGPGFYAGCPNPTRANPNNAGLPYYQNIAGSWVIDSIYDFINDFPEPPVPVAMANPQERIYQAPSGAMIVYPRSTNGITEYTATNFGGSMQGHLLAVSFNNKVYDIALDPTGTSVSSSTAILSGFGNNPLDIWCQADTDVFPGTIWVALHGENKITVFEPNDYQAYICNGTYSFALDDDGDGYSNADEIDNATDPCSQGSKPHDYDSDLLSDLNDPDDDNDGLLDTYDPFAVDSSNGLGALLPIQYGFSINGNDAIPGSLFGLGFTGLITNGQVGTAIAGDNYQSLYDETHLNLGGATSKLGIENIGAGHLLNAQNDQENGFQFGIRVDTNTYPFTVSTRLESPFFLVNGNPITPINGQSMGLIAGLGDQDNYLKIAMNAQNGNGGIEVCLESNGLASCTDYSNAMIGNVLGATTVDLYLEFQPQDLSVQALVSLDAGINKILLGNPLPIPISWFDLSDSIPMAVGVIGTSSSSGQLFDATWDFLNVLYKGPTALGLSDILVTSGSPNAVINLHDSFNDDDQDALSFIVENNTGNFVGASINNHFLTLTYPATQTDTAEIVIKATDKDGHFVFDTLVARVQNTGFPVEIIDFRASVSQNDISLNWTTAFEQNNQGFQIQIAKENIQSELVFEDRAFVEGQRDSKQISDYQYVLKDQFPGKYVLQLKQLDFNGNFSYSNRIEATISTESPFVVFPNPTNGNITLSLNTDSKYLRIELFDSLGRKVKQLYQANPNQIQQAKFHFDLGDLLAAVYIIKVHTEQGSQVQRLIKL